MNTLSNTAAVAGMLDELEKIGFDTATAMEAIGVPAAMYMGYRKGGLRGAATTGLGAAGGLGAGMAGSHYVKKFTENSPWMRRHPITKALVEATPIGMGGILGGTVGEHYAGRPKVATKIKLSGVVADFLMKKVNPIIAFDALNEAGKTPERFRRYEELLKHDAYHKAHMAAQG